MTDRFYTLTVCLEKDIRKDDAEDLIKAISMMKGVIKVSGNVTNPDVWMAEERALNSLRKKIFDVLLPK